MIEFVNEWECVTIDRLWISKRSINRQLLRSLLFYSDEKKRKKKEKEEKKKNKKKKMRRFQIQLDKSSSSSSTTAASSSLPLLQFTMVWCANALFLFFLSLSAYLIVVVCNYTKDVVCLSIKDINLLIKETSRQPTTTMCMCMRARVDERQQKKGSTITQQ